jgi:DNA-directed RNA polymerase subunit beta'
MGRNTQLSIEDDNGVQVAIYKVAYGSKLFFKNGDKVKANTKICEWDPYTTPVIAEKSGIASYVDLIDGVSIQETLMMQQVFHLNQLLIGDLNQKVQI